MFKIFKMFKTLKLKRKLRQQGYQHMLGTTCVKDGEYYRCRNCNHVIPEWSYYCPVCGYKIKWLSTIYTHK